MPVYEFKCDKCHEKFIQTISYSDYGKMKVKCPFCGSAQVSRRIGRIRVGRSESSRLENLGEMADPQKLAGLENDPREFGQALKKMSREMGEDIGPEFNDVVDRLESGQTPEDIEASMPEINTASDGEDAP